MPSHLNFYGLIEWPLYLQTVFHKVMGRFVLSIGFFVWWFCLYDSVSNLGLYSGE
jgi:hypothetical protein